MFSFGVMVILLILLTAGIVALVGDYIGRTIGRKRLSILRLRPRYTAIVFTCLTGTLIAFSTILVLLAVSKDVRTALFGLKELQSSLTQKAGQLEEAHHALTAKISEIQNIDQKLVQAKTKLASAKREILDLEETRQQLRKEVAVSRQGTVLFKVEDVLVTSLIQSGTDRTSLERGLKQVLAIADVYIKNFAGEKSGPSMLSLSSQAIEDAVSALEKSSGENVVKVVVDQNTVFGEVVPVRLEIVKNQLIFPAGTEIASIRLAPSLSFAAVEQEIKKMLATTHLTAKAAGVIPDPNGSVGSVPYSEIYALAKKISSQKKGAEVLALAKNNIYSVGPVEIKFTLHYL
jgi:uncharacterized protein (DUF3084 family)